MKKTVCIDVDGTLARYDGWKGVDHIGDPLPGAVELTKRIAEFADIMIYTTRCCSDLNHEAPHLLVNRVRAWLDKHGFVYHTIWEGQGKPIFAALIDDRALCVSCNVEYHDTYLPLLVSCVKKLCEH